MVRTYARRYGVIAIVIAVIFVGAQMMSELIELRLPMTWASVVEAFGANEVATLSMALIFVLLAWWAGRQRDASETQSRYVATLNQVTLNLLHAGDLERALNEIMLLLTRALEGEDGVLFLFTQKQFAARASTPGISAAKLESMRQVLSRFAPEMPVDKVLMRNLEDYRQQTGDTPLSDCCQMFAAPLPANAGYEAGWLVVVTQHKGALTIEQENFLQAATGQIAVSLARTQQVVELRRRARDMEAIAQINRSLLAGMDLDELLDTVANATQVRFGLPLVGIGWVDEDRQELYLRASAGSLADQVPPHYRQKLSEGVVSIVYHTGQPYLVRNTSEEPSFISVLNAPAHSFFVTPMKVGHRVIGVMGFNGLGPDAFSDEDVAALTTLTDLVTIAAESARLVSEAQHERRRVSAILRSTVDVILLVDAYDLVRLMNPPAERLLGRAAEEIIGRPIDQVLIQRPLLEVYRRVVSPVADYNGQTAGQTAEATLDNGATYLVTATIVRDEDNAFLGRVVAMKEITPLKQLDRYKSQMLQMASHDLRTPLSVATGYVELLGDELQPMTPVRSKILHGLESALQRMDALIMDLLDVERIESGVDLVRVPTDIRGLVETTVQDLQEVAQRKQQQLTLDTPPAMPLILGDPARLKQMFANLVNNAIKYTPEGGQVWIRLKREPSEALFEVQDTGYGIPPAAQAKLFQRFFRAKVPGTEHITGTGLGLSLVKAVVEQHGGRIAVESVEKQGSTFRVWLPIAMNNDQ